MISLYIMMLFSDQPLIWRKEVDVQYNFARMSDWFVSMVTV